MEVFKMKGFKKLSNMTWVLFVLWIFALPGLGVGAEDCEQADELFRQSTQRADFISQKTQLEEALRLCPKHARALNNLGTIYEAEGQLNQAEHAFRLANEYDPNLGSPLAGMGDIAMKQGRFQKATIWYQKFLIFLVDQNQKGDPRGLSLYEEEYRAKYEKAKLKLQILEDSMSGVVSSEVLTRGLKVMTVEEELSNSTRPERLSLYIYFDFNSSELKPQGRAQLIEMAQTMRSSQHRDRIFMIEGHTDTLGSDEYNLDLSRRRAEEVRTFLVSRGIVLERLKIEGVGEAKPLVLTGSQEEQAINRRVEFLRLGPYGK
jgi:outer membrane protein OmpA-like peptidoglycan-associated protein